MKQYNDTLDLIFNRRTLRAYNNKPITEEEINIIIKAALRAPTAGNLMLYSILEIKDQRLKEQLAVTCDHQPHIAKAPLVLIFLADMQRWWDYFKICKTDELCTRIGEDFIKPQESDLLLACCDALIAAQNAVIAAEALGMGSCYIGDIMENIETHRKMLNLPTWVFPITMLCIGYPKINKETIPLQPRFQKKFVHYINKYKRLDNDEFMEMFQNFERDYKHQQYINQAENMGQKVYFAKMAANYTNEMRRSVKVALKDWAIKPTKGGN
ncbi:MAG: nitroreductase family protein [Candidatus Thorarchaeota archaeon]